MSEYMDSPEIRDEQQEPIDLTAMERIAVTGKISDLRQHFMYEAVEIRRDEDGGIDGTLLFIPGVPYAVLTEGAEEKEDDLELVAEEIAEDLDGL